MERLVRCLNQSEHLVKRGYDRLEQTKIKCNICGEEFECGYAANEHRKACPDIDWDNMVLNPRPKITLVEIEITDIKKGKPRFIDVSLDGTKIEEQK